jgi:hypothetical protein
MILQLNPSIPVRVVKSDDFPNGTGECVGWIDYGPEHDLLWMVIFDETGESWQVPNHLVRGIKNVSIGRNLRGKR